MSDTIIPRPGLKPTINITLNFDENFELTEIEKAELEADINEEFVEPGQIGELSLTFRSDVSQALLGEVTIKTDSSLMFDDVMDDLINITEKRVDANVASWEINAIIERDVFSDVDVQQRRR